MAIDSEENTYALDSLLALVWVIKREREKQKTETRIRFCSFECLYLFFICRSLSLSLLIQNKTLDNIAILNASETKRNLKAT